MISSIEVPWEPLGFKRSLPSPEALKIFVCKHQMKSVMKFLHKNVGFFLRFHPDRQKTLGFWFFSKKKESLATSQTNL